MFTRIALFLTWVFLSTLSTHAAPPNIIVILADDMGYGDLGCMGSEHLRTPHLDALAESGTLCTQAYVASPVCSPSRAGLLTGRDPRRFGYEGNLNKGHAAYPTRPELLGLPPGEHTLGDHLRAAGYATALIGKWHLGIGEGFHPNDRGFDHFCGMLTGSHSYFPTQGKNHQIERNGAAVTEFSSEYLTDFFTDEGLSWIDAQEKADAEKPWFAFFSYNAPHGPMHATDEDKALFHHIEDEKRRIYAAMMWALDRGVGRIHEALEKHGKLDNTLIVFFSDNGGATGNSSWNGPLSGVKGCLKEGGVRIPMIWSWPGTIPAGLQHTSPVSSLDLLPTFLAAAGSDPLPLRDPLSHEDKRNRERAVKKWGAYDGVDLLPQLFNPDKATNITDRTLFWRLQGQTAILSGEEKLIRLSHRPAQMFRPASDPAEISDLAPSGGDRFLELFQQLGDWEATLPTVPLWGSSPMWSGESAKNYDTWQPRPEPE
jgi:arylsulfatase B